MLASESRQGGTSASSAGSNSSCHNDSASPSAQQLTNMSKRNVMSSGMSALIQAATCQLGHLAEAAVMASTRDNNMSKNSNGYSSYSTVDTAYQSYNNQENLHNNSYTSKDGSIQQQPSSLSSNEQQNNNITLTPNLVPSPADEPTIPTVRPDPTRQSLPELLMALATDPANANVIAFLPDDKFFAIRVREFTSHLMPLYFSPRVFSDFLYMLREWGFIRVSTDSQYQDQQYKQRRSSLPGTSTNYEGSNAARYSSSNNSAVATVSSGGNNNNNNNNRIEIFRHPYFIKGDWKRCATIRFGDDLMEKRMSLLPSRTSSAATTPYSKGDNMSHSDDSIGSTLGGISNNAKRKLSPNYLARRSSETSQTSRHRLEMAVSATSEDGERIVNFPELHKDSSGDFQHYRDRKDLDEDESVHTRNTSHEYGSLSCSSSYHGTNNRLSDDIRSVALSITAEKLSLRNSSHHVASSRRSSVGLGSVQQLQITDGDRDEFHYDNDTDDEDLNGPDAFLNRAVESCTQSILTDAVEALLRDEQHTKATFRKHEQELSRSNVPGLVPISKQLFATNQAFVNGSFPATKSASQYSNEDGTSIESVPVKEVTATTTTTDTSVDVSKDNLGSRKISGGDK